ncbi:DUF4269 domain-containing protein [Cytobacillus dafuensis]|uniref:DUF4269 domain-containing protein n=1 Tax=Cytobacillus dafuensis TaxID=1742359 RepID=A0A5B8Z6Y1_CYTDA|nr:DUF4269 domain-containing protein [Cytobacillus dafuensis]QED48922.1 DUF4269 domain-containing protein [Cytobacillus dafuensis]
MFRTIEYLNVGNERQRNAYKVISTLGIMKDLEDFTPLLCGTIPIEIDIGGSDLDIILEVHHFNQFGKKVESLYGDKSEFRSKQTNIRNSPVIKVNFMFEGFEFELFGQPKPVLKQNAFLHMLIEYRLMQESPQLKEEVLTLKHQGYKTEPAFCKILGLQGDPYERLLEYGIEKGIINEMNLS